MFIDVTDITLGELENIMRFLYSKGYSLELTRKWNERELRVVNRLYIRKLEMGKWSEKN